jgi:hypothetical protein
VLPQVNGIGDHYTNNQHTVKTIFTFRQYVRQVAKLALSRKTRIHLLANDANIPHGFTALSLSHLLEQSFLVVDYLFTSREYRGISFDDLGMKIIRNNESRSGQ